ncbi:hypothetical protein BZG36_05259 [Bifiguratus adelaidae]|uniref:PSP1 C-terminal domain-containing protein n=1 Tax=Bifiguratus adelaidae TaxID=1938954 RepID=A0A261XTV9_9FUNG|nr:hypothetical protein BZG36_05259 [Bifiguratus adelaidae]
MASLHVTREARPQLPSTSIPMINPNSNANVPPSPTNPNAPSTAWRAVGSPPRRASGPFNFSQPLKAPIPNQETRQDPTKAEQNVINGQHGERSTPANAPTSSQAGPNQPKWGSISGIQWAGPSIWSEGNAPRAPKSAQTKYANPPPGIPVPPNVEQPSSSRSVSFASTEQRYEPVPVTSASQPSQLSHLPLTMPLEPGFREQRSMSYSVGQPGEYFGYPDSDGDPKSRNGSMTAASNVRDYRSALATMHEEEDEPEEGHLEPPKFRVRSKSSGAAFGLVGEDHGDEGGDDLYVTGMFGQFAGTKPTGGYRRVSVTTDTSRYGGVPGYPDDAHAEATFGGHRRASTSVASYGSLWDKTSDISKEDAETMDKTKGTRRYSLAQMPSLDYSTAPSHDESDDLGPLSRSAEETSIAQTPQRRHSLGGPTLASSYGSLPYPNDQYLANALDNLTLDPSRPMFPAPYISPAPFDPSQMPFLGDTMPYGMPTRDYMDSIHNYFDSDEHRMAQEMGKGVPLHSLPTTGPLYVVEFKAGRTDLFYVTEGSGFTPNVGDLVIVEADRGKDLGKIVVDNLGPHQIQMYQQQAMAASRNAGEGASKDVRPKRIYHRAAPHEVALLMAKGADEAKALLLCQTKVRQRRLPMEVVDAEFQWDRRKLTFYFIADHRIDFRELVRELFKIYKTRIWMCAVNSLVNQGLIETSLCNRAVKGKGMAALVRELKKAQKDGSFWVDPDDVDNMDVPLPETDMPIDEDDEIPDLVDANVKALERVSLGSSMPRSIGGMQIQHEMDSSAYKSWICLYPIYIDKSKSLPQGRKISKEKAVDNPTGFHMAHAARQLGFSVVYEHHKAHPKDFFNPGRVRVQLKHNNIPLNSNIKTRQQLAERIAQLLPSIQKSHPLPEEMKPNYTPPRMIGPMPGMPGLPASQHVTQYIQRLDLW